MVVGAPTPPLPALDIYMGPLWIRSKSGGTTLATTLPTPHVPRPPPPYLPRQTRGACTHYLRVWSGGGAPNPAAPGFGYLHGSPVD